MDITDIIFKIWIAQHWEIILSCALAYILLVGFNKWTSSFDENGELSPQEKIKSFAFFVISFFVLAIIIMLLFSYFFG